MSRLTIPPSQGGMLVLGVELLSPSCGTDRVDALGIINTVFV